VIDRPSKLVDHLGNVDPSGGVDHAGRHPPEGTMDDPDVSPATDDTGDVVDSDTFGQQTIWEEGPGD